MHPVIATYLMIATPNNSQLLISAIMSIPISLDEEVRLYSNNSEREKYNTLATLYGIIVALEYLERAYVRDSITSAECVSATILTDYWAECLYF